MTERGGGGGGEPDRLSLTAPQAGIWLDVLAGRNTIEYNLCDVFRFVGPLDVEALSRAVLQSHAEADALHLRIAIEDGRPRQTAGRGDVDFAVLDLAVQSAALGGREAQAEAEIEALRARPLSPEGGPMSRYRIIRLAPDRHWWVRVHHHLVIDAYGGKVQAERVADIYSALVRGEAPPPAAPGAYADFIATDAAYPGSSAHAADVAYWRARLAAGAEPIGFSAGPGGAAPGAVRLLDRPLPAGRAVALQRVAAAAGTSLQATVLAAYLLLLGRCAATRTPACALPLLNRKGRTERLTVGLFAHAVPFGIALDDAEPFVELVRAVGRQLRGDFRHMRLAAAHMRAAGLDPWPDRGGRRAVFDGLDYPIAPAFAGLATTVDTLAFGPIDDVGLFFIGYDRHRDGAGALLRWGYNGGAYERSEVERLAGRLDALLAAAADEPQCPLADLPAMGEAEAAAVAAWEVGPALAEGSERDFVHERFLAWASRKPAAPAVTGGGRTATYGELAEMAAGVAARLAAEGLAAEQPVGLCLAPSPELVAAFLGILMAGGASLQLDPLLPAGRLDTMIRGVGCRLVLTDAPSRDRLPEASYGLRVLAVDEAGFGGAGMNGRPVPSPDRLACIFHTSGSTGRPKPVGLTHGALAAKMRSIPDVFGFSEADDECVCGAASIGFDPWLQQVLLPLCTGGRMWMPDRTQAADVAAFWRAVVDHETTHLNLVPSMLAGLLPGVPAGGVPGVRRLVVGGERLSPDLARRAAAALGVDAVWNMYGPTEATVEASGCRASLVDSGEEVPIGRPVPGYVVRILDDRLRRVPVGAVGELCIGGVGLARGYLGMPEATAEAFVDDPFGPPGSRLYRSGDRAAWRGDGNLLYRGRADQQVKVRGQRIELGEVEATLLRQPGVEGAAVLFEPTAGGGRLVAHVVGRVEAGALRRGLARDLPDAAVPADYVLHRGLPLLASGKVDRQALSRIRPTGPAAPLPAVPAAASGRRLSLQRAIAAVWADLLDGEAPPPDANLFDAGVHSLLVPRAQPRLSDLAGREVSAVEIFRYPTIARLAAHLAGEAEPGPAGPSSPAPPATVDDAADRAVAIVGMALRVPGADDPEAFWQNLLDGVESVGTVDAASLRAAGLDNGVVADPSFVGAHGRLSGIDMFDPAAFGYTPGEAAAIDPQQRLLLELALQALEDAACDPARQGPIGAFVGVGFPSYVIDNLGHRLRDAGAERYTVILGNDKDYAASRLAYKLGLTGPVMAVLTACSTGLTAVAQAVQALRAGQCRAVLAGAVSLGMMLAGGYRFSEGGIGSRSGRCRPFDAGADGTVAGSGGAVLLLKRLCDAEADGDTIHAVIRGVGLSNDGAVKAAFTAPTVHGQAAALTAALADSGVDPGSVGFVEGHATATTLGDPIEVEALNAVYGLGAEGPIWLGSHKGNIGHLDAASGVVGLIKAALAVREGMVPPTCNFTTPNPDIPFAKGPFRVSDRRQPWPPGDGPRRAAVNSFGVGGANVHVIVEQAPRRPASTDGGRQPTPELLVLSAADGEALDDLSGRLAARLDAADAPPLADAAHTLQVGRRRLPCRRALVARDGRDAARRLAEAAAVDGRNCGGASIAFLFPGQGVQAPGMGRALYDEAPAFRAVVDQAATVLAGTPAAAVRDLLLAEPTDAAAAARLAETDMTQPALFIVEYATARVLMAWGIRPDALAGHSVGEYVAAALAGVMSFEAALSLVAERGRLMASASPGAMLALPLAEAEAQALIAGLDAADAAALSLAAVNGPRQCVAAGPEAAVLALQRLTERHNRPARRLNVSHAFHSRLMEPILDAFGRAVARVPLAEPSVPFLSNLSGTWITPAEVTDPAYWVRHLRGTVRFADNLAALRADPARILVEVGPGSTLMRLARSNGVAEADAVATQPDIDGGRAALLEAVGRLWVRGVEPDWDAMADGRPRRRVPLPGYPFRRVRAWIDPHSGPVDLRPKPVEAPTSATDDPFRRSATLESVLAVWRDVFGIPEIDADSDFLGLGGDSIVALRIVSRLQEASGSTASVAAVFATRTPAGLVRVLEEAMVPTAQLETGVL